MTVPFRNLANLRNKITALQSPEDSCRR